eukprot:PhM_4_TR15582/c0_g1_i1/m.80956
MGFISIEIQRGRDLVPRDVTGRSDPFCTIHVGHRVFTTPTRMQTLNPVWGPDCVYKCPDVPANGVVHIEVFDWDVTGDAEFMGSVTIDAASMTSAACWYPLGIRRLKGTVTEEDRALWLQHKCSLGEIYVKWHHFHSDVYAQCIGEADAAGSGTVDDRRRVVGDVNEHEEHLVRCARRLFQRLLTVVVFCLGALPNTLAEGLLISIFVTTGFVYGCTLWAVMALFWFHAANVHRRAPAQCPALLTTAANVLYDDESVGVALALLCVHGRDADPAETESAVERLLVSKPTLCRDVLHLVHTTTYALQTVNSLVLWNTHRTVPLVEALLLWGLVGHTMLGLVLRTEHAVVIFVWYVYFFRPLQKLVPALREVSVLRGVRKVVNGAVFTWHVFMSLLIREKY